MTCDDGLPPLLPPTRGEDRACASPRLARSEFRSEDRACASPRLAPSEIEALRAKYVEMLRLREADAAGTLPDPRPAMRALAAAFPGALREIDALERSEIEARIAAIDRALADPAAVSPWMAGLTRYHALLRAALGARRACRRTVQQARALGDPVLDALDDTTLGAMLRPPDGRLNRVVLAVVARELGTSPEQVEDWLRSPARP